MLHLHGSCILALRLVPSVQIQELLLMLAKLYSCAVLGLEGGLIEVEVDISQGLPAFSLPDTFRRPPVQAGKTQLG